MRFCSYILTDKGAIYTTRQANTLLFMLYNILLFSDGSFGVAIPQLDRLKLVPPNRSLKQLESLLGMTLQSHHKVKAELNPCAAIATVIRELAYPVIDFRK